ncbi:SH3 domain-containing protein [Amylocystis lapponica]|nr:SH3 domain-containing protein [Amylocystis lapponica]
MSQAAYIAHIISQTEQNVSFLLAQNVISPSDAADITSRLNASQSTRSIANDMQSLAITAPVAQPPPPRRVPPPAARTQRARALWAYNENGQEANDLSFSSGEVVEIIDETNADWWTGRCRGRQGLFPSNHVEKLDSPASPPPAPIPSPMAMPVGPPMGMPMQPSYVSPQTEKPIYRPFGAVQQPPPQELNPIGMQQVQPPPPPPQKKNRFGNLGNTVSCDLRP